MGDFLGVLGMWSERRRTVIGRAERDGEGDEGTREAVSLPRRTATLELTFAHQIDRFFDAICRPAPRMMKAREK